MATQEKQPLHLKYRPQEFDDVIGQGPVVASLKSVLRDRVPHAYLFTGPSGCGKCLGEGTPVLMFNGTIKRVEEISVGDRVMGPDSKPRVVYSVTSGVEALWKVVPAKGDPFVCNNSHILSLRKHKQGNYVVRNVPLFEYRRKSKTFKGEYKLWRTGVDFSEHAVPVDPYFLGIWLGDGNSSGPTITTPEPEVVEFLKAFSASENLAFRFVARCGKAAIYRINSGKHGGDSRDGRNHLLERMRGLEVIGNKHVPQVYKRNSRGIRLQILAGILDADGHLHGPNCYDYISSRRELSEDVVFLARSLGLAAYLKPGEGGCFYKGEWRPGMYYRVSIMGETSGIPCKVFRRKASVRKSLKDVCQSSFTLKSMGVGRYYGFTLGGTDGLFLLGDFTVTHNTTLARIVARKVGIESQHVQEIDGATNSSVEAVRDLTSMTQYAGFGSGGKRFVIIDEAHALSKSAWQAFLKSIEEPPPHVYWAFCTTESEKVPRTIQTRCVSYELKLVKSDDIADYLIAIAEEEGLKVPEDLCVLAARRAEGSVRQALVFLAMLDGCKSEEDAKSLLEAAHEHPDVINFVKSMLEKKLTWRLFVDFLKGTDMSAESIRMTTVRYLSTVLIGTTDEKKATRVLMILTYFAEPYRQSEGMAPLLLSVGNILYGGSDV